MRIILIALLVSLAGCEFKTDESDCAQACGSKGYTFTRGWNEKSCKCGDAISAPKADTKKGECRTVVDGFRQYQEGDCPTPK